MRSPIIVDHVMMVNRLRSFVRCVLTIVGILWNIPNTLINFLFHVGPLWLIGTYAYVGRIDNALFWALDKDHALNTVKNAWKGWGGMALGNVVVLREHPSKWNADKTIRHELAHVRQAMILGFLFPVLYIVIYVALVLIRDEFAYFDHSFEIAARREAGQTTDPTRIVAMINEPRH